LPDNGKHFFARKKTKHWSLKSFHRDPQRLFDDMQCSDISASCELQESAQRRQTRVTATHTVVAVDFKMIEKCQDEGGCDIRQ
jgi:hypothetical protein